jgi:hypothetical protein
MATLFLFLLLKKGGVGGFKGSSYMGREGGDQLWEVGHGGLLEEESIDINYGNMVSCSAGGEESGMGYGFLSL